MTLPDLGFDAWFQKKLDEVGRPDISPARITRVDRERYLVMNGTGEIEAEATGNLIFSAESTQELPCVGDWVTVQYYNEGTLAIIHGILPRRSFLRRKTAGKKIDYQMIASNIDTAFIMQSCDGNFNLRRLERYLVMAGEGRIKPVILLSKTDLLGQGELSGMILAIEKDHINTPVIPFSNSTGYGMDELRRHLEPSKTYCLLGSSGVGKTTLLNNLLGRMEFETAPVREKDGRGVHTTTRRQLTLLEDGALLIDTPGMRELGMIAVGGSIGENFSDVQELTSSCRFNDCRHTVEAGCALIEAVKKGEFDEERYQSYIKLMKESEFHQLSYAEKRKKDKKFGRMVNVSMKQLRKRKPPEGR